MHSSRPIASASLAAKARQDFNQILPSYTTILGTKAAFTELYKALAHTNRIALLLAKVRSRGYPVWREILVDSHEDRE